MIKNVNEAWSKMTSHLIEDRPLISFMEHRIGNTIGRDKKPAILSVLSHEVGVTEGPQPVISILSHRVGNKALKEDRQSLLSVLSHQVGERSHGVNRNQPFLSVLSHFVG